jgi:DNA uptake protein ComE-like DNA-binding protein
MTITSKGKRWELLHSLWLGWVIFSFGLLSWAAFLYIGIRAKQRKWVLWGLAYVAVGIVLAIALPDTTTNTFVSFVVWLIAIVHVFQARREYLVRLEVLQSSGVAPNTAQRPKIGPQYGANTSSAPSSEEAAAASSWTSLGHSVPSAQMFKSSQPADITSSTVDLNSASEQELATLLGLGTIMAKRAVSFREAQGGFRSVEDFGRVLNLEPDAVERQRTRKEIRSAVRVRSSAHVNRLE